MSTLDGTIVIVALPRMQAELDLSDAGKSWVITAYVLAFGGLLLLGGRIGDAVGPQAGVPVAASACSRSHRWSAAWRSIRDDADRGPRRAGRRRRGRGADRAGADRVDLRGRATPATGRMAVSAAMQAAGSVLGLVLGGALTVISWRLAFLINVPIGIVIIAIALTRLAETHHERLQARRHRRSCWRLWAAHRRCWSSRRGRRWAGRTPGSSVPAVATVLLFAGVPGGGALRRPPHRADVGVHQPQPGDDVHRRCSWPAA